MIQNLDNICTSLSPLHGVSTADSILSALTILFTAPLNLVIIISILKYPHLLYRSFYLIIANIALADLLAGLWVCPLSINFHTKEALSSPISEAEPKALHSGFFITNGASVLSMTLLSMDRLGCLINPFIYYAKVTRPRTIIMIVLTWLLAGSLVSLYLTFGYIRFLFIFSATTLFACMLMMVLTTILFMFRLQQSKRAEHARKASSLAPHTVCQSATKKQDILNNFTQMDKDVTKMFIRLLLLFLINYIPAVVLTLYMNFSPKGSSCPFIHLMRDFIFLSILTSGLWRAINFYVCLVPLRDSAKMLIMCQKRSHCKEISCNTIVML